MKWKILTIIFFLILFYDLAAFYVFLYKQTQKTPSVPRYNFLQPQQKVSITPVPKQAFTPQFPTLETIFVQNHVWTATLSAENIRIITATGDVIPARSVNNNVLLKNNPLWSYEKVINTFKTKKSDVLFINLETPLIPNCQSTVEGMIFCGAEQNIQGLQYLGVTVANLANNHQGNHGVPGIENTKKLLTEKGILYTGVNGAVIKNIRGMNFAFLGYNAIGAPENGLSWADEEKIKQEIATAKQQADVVIVQFHWGTEYQSQPDASQKKLGRFAIDSGADLVIGNHPHWIQPVELYKNKLITYAHGNFVFDQMWSQKTREGVVGWYTFYDNQLIDVEYLPVQIDDYGQPHFVDGQQKELILQDMKKQSMLVM